MAELKWNEYAMAQARVLMPLWVLMTVQEWAQMQVRAWVQVQLRVWVWVQVQLRVWVWVLGLGLAMESS